MYTPWWQRLSKPTFEERFELRRFKSGGPVKRYGFKYGGSWADWQTNYSDQMTFEEYLQDDNIVKKPHFLDRKADGGRIGFDNGGLSTQTYQKLYKDYVELVETAFKNENLIGTPSWDKYVQSQGYKGPSINYYADKPTPTKLLREKKLELAKKLIDAENLKLDGTWKGSKEGASSIFQGKIFNNRIGQKPGTIEGDVGRLVDKYLDSRNDKIKRAFNYIMNPEYKMSTKGYTGVAHEIQKLIAPNTEKGRITKDIRKILQTIPEYEAVEDKLKYINRILTKVPEGTDTSMGYLMEMAENNKVGRANFEDWWRLAGDKPEQFAMREVVRNWNAAQGKGDFKLYDLNGEEIIWKGKDTKLNTNKILFSYADEGDLGYKNKLYSFFKPDAKTLANINKTVPNKGVFDLKGNIRNLKEFNELVEVVDGRNKLYNTEMIDPFTNKKSTYKKVYENIYKRINTSAFTTKEGYSRASAMAGHIDHDFGTKKYPFNNLRISTGQQNHLFKTLVDAAAKNPDLEPYVRAIESEVYKGGSVDDQIKAIVRETDELGKVVKNTKTKITMPTATEMAAYKFLKNEIPEVPESVLKYLRPKAAVVEKLVVDNKLLGKWIQEIGTSLSVEDTNKVSTAIQSIMNKKNSGLNVADIFQWGKAELSVLDDIGGKLPSKSLGAFGKILKGVGIVGTTVEPVLAAMNFSQAMGEGLSGKEAAIYTGGKFIEDIANIPAVIGGAAKWGKGKLTGEDTPFKLPYEATFARDWKEKTAEAIPENVKLRRAAEIEFDTTMLPNMTMMDDMEMPASKNEIEMARDTFLKGKLGENYQVTHPKDFEKEKEEITGVDKYIINRFNPNV